MTAGSAHGVRWTYQQGCKCVPCRAAEARYRSELRKRHAKGLPILGSILPAADAARMVRSIQIEGYRRRQLAEQAGLHRNTLPGLKPSQLVQLRTILRVKRAYRIMIGD